MPLVYSTGLGEICPKCNKQVKQCACKTNQSFNSQEFIKLRLETKGRKGKGVTLIEGIGGSETELKELAKRLKQKCNCGGSLKNGVIEIQGNHRETIKIFLEDFGYKVKLAGG